MEDRLNDPFGNLHNFLLFTSKKDYSLSALQVVNETKGRWYLNHYTYQMAKTADFSKLSPKDLAFWVGVGGAYELKMRDMGEEHLNFPRLPFNEGFVSWLVKLDPQRPLLQYQACLLAVHTGTFALKALELSRHRDLGNLIEFAITNTRYSEHWQELWQKLAPSVPLPERDDDWQRIQPIMKAVDKLQYREDFLKSFDSIEDMSQDALVALDQLIPEELSKRPEIVLDAGLKDKLGGYFRECVRHDLQDKLKHERLFVRGIPESELSIKTEEATIPFFETVPSEEPEPWEIEEKKEELRELFDKAKLKERPKKVVLLRAEGYDYERIANTLSITPELARSIYSNAMKKLREIKKRT